MTWWAFILVVAGTCLLLWFPQNCQHEGLHALFARRYGATITRFRPYPHRDPEGGWNFASVSWINSRKMTDKEKSNICFAPWVFNGILVILLSLGNHFGPHHFGSAVLLGWTINNLVDGANNARLAVQAAHTKRFDEVHSDIPRASRHWGYTAPLTTAMMIGWFISSTALTVLGAIP